MRDLDEGFLMELDLANSASRVRTLQSGFLHFPLLNPVQISLAGNPDCVLV